MGWLSQQSLSPLGEAVAFAIHIQDVDVVSQAILQGTGYALRTEQLGPFIEGQVAGHQDRSALIALTEELKEGLCASL